MTNTNTIILSPEQINNIVSQITSNVSEHMLSNTTITTNVISPMDFISMQNHIITFWLTFIAIILVVGGFFGIWYFTSIVKKEASVVANKTAKEEMKDLFYLMEKYMNELITKIEVVKSDEPSWKKPEEDIKSNKPTWEKSKE